MQQLIPWFLRLQYQLATEQQKQQRQRLIPSSHPLLFQHETKPQRQPLIFLFLPSLFQRVMKKSQVALLSALQLSQHPLPPQQPRPMTQPLQRERLLLLFQIFPQYWTR